MAATVKPKPVTVKFTKEKETPGTVRYAEVVPDDDVANVRTLYIQKHFAKALGFPDELTVTFTA
jgi:hypothetical protein